MVNDDILGIPAIQIWVATGGFLIVEGVNTEDGFCLVRKIAVTAEEAGAMVAHLLAQGHDEVTQEFEDDFKGEEVPVE